MRRRVNGRIATAFIALFTVMVMLTNSVSASVIRSVKVTYKADQSSARDMLSAINSWRTSGDAWYWNAKNTQKVKTGKLAAYKYDYALEKIAIQRAIECSVSLSSKRPDGSVWSTCTFDGARTYAENIAYGYKTASDVFKAWKEENAQYAGQSHRRNMLGSYTCIGIAHVVVNGTDYWVQEFSNFTTTTGKTPVDTDTKTIEIPTDVSSCDLSATSVSQLTVDPGETGSLPKVEVSYIVNKTTKAVVPASDCTIKWTSSNTSVVSVSGSTFTANAQGDATLTATVTVDGKTAKATVPVAVAATSSGKPISGDTITATIPDEEEYIYTGSEIKPVPTVKDGSTTLKEGTDYTVSYSSNIDAGNAVITLRGKGEYGGIRSITFTIAPKQIDKCTVKPISDQEYTSLSIVPEVVVNDGNKVLTTTDYSVDFTNNKDVGTVQVNIRGKGNYDGLLQTTFNITPINVSKLTIAPVEDQVYTGKAIKPYLSVKFGDLFLTPPRDFSVSYSKNTNLGTASFKATFTGNYTGTYSGTFKIVEYKKEPGWQKAGDTYVYVLSDGSLKKSAWLGEGSKWYYFDADGYMVKGLYDISGKTYYFDGSGVMCTGWQQIDGAYYYFDKSGIMVKGWQQISKVWYYLDAKTGKMAKGICKIEGKLYNFKDSGALATGWFQNEDGTYMYFTSTGAVTGWQQISKVWYYFDKETYIMATGVKTIDGKIYLFAAGGAMQKSGWKQAGDDWYYLTSGGEAYMNKWLQSGKKWYYFGADGKMVKNTKMVIDGTEYEFDENGVMK